MARVSFQETSKSIGAFQNLNSWEIQFILNPGLGVKMPDHIRYRCTSAGEIPNQEMGELSATINGFTIKQPGIVKRNGSIELTFLDDETGQTRLFFNELDKAFMKFQNEDVSLNNIGWDKIKSTMIAYLLDSKGNRAQGYKAQECILFPQYSGELGTDDSVLLYRLKVDYNNWIFTK